MPALVGLAMVALAAALARRSASEAGVDLEAALVGATLTIAVIGGLAATLALADVFGGATMALATASAAAAIGAFGGRRRAQASAAPPTRSGIWILVAVVTLAGLALRAPLQRAELAGRDQGTYVLRARHLLRSGGVGLRDRVLAQAGAERGREGPMDLLGLYPIDGDPARAGVYEGAYRPGLYLASRERGEVVPQFLHMHPSLLASAGLVVGPRAATSILFPQAALALLLLAAIARRLWPAAPLAAPLAAGLLAASPLAIWVLRTPLSESVTLCFGLGALLSFLRGGRVAGAILLGAIAWARGNAWLAAPLLLAALWLRPPAARLGGSITAFLGLLLASLAVHAFTAYPYLHDELGRQLASVVAIGPWTLIGLGITGALGWALVDRLIARRPRAPAAALRPHALRVALVTALVLVVVYAALAQRAGEGPPFSRLDPALAGLGLPLLGAAALGLGLGLRIRLSQGTDPWLTALMTLPLTSLALYAQRNLPQAGLFYYGRYLVPELLPAAILLAVHAIVCAPLPRRLARPLRALAGAALLAAVAAPLIRQPVVRVDEFAGSERIVDAIAADLPPEAIVIAGGEGWHSAHAFNQVGGALLLGHGVQVLPYRDAEATYAALHELLIAGPAARGEAPPPVYLLLGEATHAVTRVRGGPKVAAIDDALPGPFSARPVGFYELYSDRLTPRVDALPDAVTRSDLRLGLFAVEIDPAAAAGGVVHRFAGGEVGDGVRLSGGTWREGHLCLAPDHDLIVTLDPSPGPRALVVVAGAGAAAHTRAWSVVADGEALPTALPATAVAERDTLGPWTRRQGPRELRIRGSAAVIPGAACPHGALAELRLLALPPPPPPPQGGVPARTFAPAHDLGHPVRPAEWVRGRSLSRLRPGITPEPVVEGMSLRLGDGERLRFPAITLPRGPGAWVLHLTRAEVGRGAIVDVVADGEAIASLEVPAQGRRSWQSPPIGAVARDLPVVMELRLRAAGGGSIAVRDLAFFADPVIARSALAEGR